MGPQEKNKYTVIKPRRDILDHRKWEFRRDCYYDYNNKIEVLNLTSTVISAEDETDIGVSSGEDRYRRQVEPKTYTSLSLSNLIPVSLTFRLINLEIVGTEVYIWLSLKCWARRDSNELRGGGRGWDKARKPVTPWFDGDTIYTHN